MTQACRHLKMRQQVVFLSVGGNTVREIAKYWKMMARNLIGAKTPLVVTFGDPFSVNYSPTDSEHTCHDRFFTRTTAAKEVPYDRATSRIPSGVHYRAHRAHHRFGAGGEQAPVPSRGNLRTGRQLYRHVELRCPSADRRGPLGGDQRRPSDASPPLRRFPVPRPESHHRVGGRANNRIRANEAKSHEQTCGPARASESSNQLAD